MAKQTRRFKTGADYFYNLVFKQAGSLSKAVLEAVMNAVDAKASRVDITLSNTTVVIRDDGIGFDGMSELERYFETLCFDHKTDSRSRDFGEFGIGRCQGFAWGTSIWRTRKYQMAVDVKHRGDEWELEDDLESFDGCEITITFYDPLSGSDVHRTARELSDLARYCALPVFLNGERISFDASAEKWDHVTEDAYIRLRDTGDLAVYNKGILVSRLPGWRFGGGDVVTKEALSLNMARNDILERKCLVWRKITPFLKNEREKSARKKPTLTDDERRMLLNSWMDGDLTYSDVADRPIFKMVHGRCIQPKSLRYGVSNVALASEDDRFAAERAHQMGMALVFAPEMYQWLGGIATGADQTVKEQEFHAALLAMMPHVDDRLTLMPISDIAHLADGDHEIIKESDLTKRDKIIFGALRAGYDRVVKKVEDVRGEADSWKQHRNLVPGRSQSALGWTDGSTYVAIDLHHARKALQGLPGALAVAHTLIHEQCHKGVFTQRSHPHDHDFYELFHDASRDIGTVAKLILSRLIAGLKRADITINKKLFVAADLHQDANGYRTDDGPVPENADATPPTPPARRRKHTRTVQANPGESGVTVRQLTLLP